MKQRSYGVGLFATLVALAIYAYLVPFGSTRLDYISAFDESPFDVPPADHRVDCGSDNFDLTTSVWRLPNGMRDILGGSEMSSAGGPFNPSDVGDGPRLRFGAAAVVRNHIFVTVEYGGIGYGVGIWAFKRKDFFHWVGHPIAHAGDVPKSLSEFLKLTCKR